jgi:hypothetical protein
MFDKDGNLKDEIVKLMIENQKKVAKEGNLLPRSMLMERDAPIGTKCPSCDKEGLKIRSMPLTGPYSGSIICLSCNYRDSVVNFLGKQMFQVQPMPQGAEQIYLKDPEDEE